ncbi:MAG TPA: pectinesterase family protein [Acidobacteriaceae bacterium]|jgi:pectinesterase
MRKILIAALLAALSAHAEDVHVRVSPDVKTGTRGTTEFPTIQTALDHHPFATPNANGTPGRVFIEIAPGTYHERIIVTQNHANITLLGTGKSPADTVITNSLSESQAGGTFFTETAEINGAAFQADNLTFANTATDGSPAVAIAVRSDRAIFKHVRILGNRHTLFADYGRQYYVDSYIEGGIHFIFGNATAVFESDELHSLIPGVITTHSRAVPTDTTGYVILNSKVTSAHSGPVGLGDPWRTWSRTVFLHTELPANTDPAGWNDRDLPANQKTAWYGEFANTGPGATPSTRVHWAHQLTATEAKAFLPATFLAGPDHWNPIAEAAKLP